MTLAVVVEPGVTVDGDRALLRQALANLLENAVKYCRQGDGIEISARLIADGAELVVSDTGAEISYEDQSRVFERFYRVDRAGRGSRAGPVSVSPSSGTWLRPTAEPPSWSRVPGRERRSGSSFRAAIER